MKNADQLVVGIFAMCKSACKIGDEEERGNMKIEGELKSSQFCKAH